MKKYIFSFIFGMFISWYLYYQGFITNTYYKVFNPELIEKQKIIYYNFDIESPIIKNLKVSNIESNINDKNKINNIVKNESFNLINNYNESNLKEKLESNNILLTLYYHYDNTNSPISDKKMLNILESITNSWIKCGVQIKMFPNDNFSPKIGAFKINSIYTKSDDENDKINNFYIVWVDNDEFNGEANTLGYLDTENNISFIQKYNIQLSKKYFNDDMLKSVIIHEFGHAIGLPHSLSKSDIMFPTITSLKNFPKETSYNDIENCKIVLKQLDLKTSQENINKDQ